MKHNILMILLIGIIFCSCNNAKKIERIGHRGAMGYETENTLASIEKALELGVDMVEIDVFRCQSKEIIVFHDKRLERLTNGTGFVEDFTFVQLKYLTVNGGHSIPLLQDVLKLVAKRCRINIELKGTNTADKVHHILTYYIEKNGWKPKDFLVSSFNEKELRNFYALTKDIPIGILTKENPIEALEMARELNAVSIHAHYQKLSPEAIKAVQQQGFKLYAGVVNDAKDIQKMKAFGVDGIFSDFPDRVY